MFKYPPPWQVLCSSLEKREQVSVNGGQSPNPSHSEPLIDNTNEHYVTHSSGFQVQMPSEYHNITSTDAQSNKEFEIEVLKTSKLTIEPEAQTKSEYELQETDIHANKERTYILEEQKPNLTELQTTTSSQVPSMDRVTRSMIFSLSSAKSIDGSQEDLINSTTVEIQEAEKINNSRDVWVPPPDRNSRLKLLREEERFEIRSHLPEPSPTKLFVDSDGEDDDKVRPRSRQFTPEKAWELEQERRDIIRKQGQRKSLDTEDLISIRDGNDASVSDIDLSGVGSGQKTVDVDTEQINFEAARQQFLTLEKKRNSLPITPRLHSRPSRLSTRSMYEHDQYLEFTKVNDPLKMDQHVKPDKDKSSVTQEKAEKDESSSLLRKQFFRELSVDIVDTGEKGRSSEVYREEPTQDIPEEKESIPNPSDETPIEREIRLALQREESLRKERGIQSSGETKEMVEILKTPVLSISSVAQLSKKGKDRSRTSFFIQREIEKEVQREADLKSEGKVAGLYDKGNVQELDERRKLFERLDEIPVQPQKGATKLTSTGITGNTKENIAQVELGQNSEIKNWTVVDAPQPYSARTSWKPGPLTTYRNRRLSADNILDFKTPTETSSEKEASEETVVQCKENFHVQPWKSRLHVQENDGEDEKDYKTESIRESHGDIYNTRLRPSISNVIEQEIQQSLERDRELQEQRRKSGVPLVTIPKDNQPTTPHNGYNQYGRSSLTSDALSPWSPAPERGTPGSILTSYTISPVQMFRPRRYPKFVVSESDADKLRKHHNWYAGIDPRDDVNTEIVESTRVNRHKNTMALRWEAGLYANEPSD